MKDFFLFLKRFAFPYKGYIILSFVFSILTSVLTVFSFAFIIPILQMLFGINTQEYHYMEFGSASINDVAVNNFYYYMSELVKNYGPEETLGILGLLLIVMTGFKCLSIYLSEAMTIPMRNGVCRTLRNEMYAKILSLPIGFFTNERKGDIIARISGDVLEVESSVLSSIYAIFKQPIQIIIYLGMMIAISWKLTIFVFILLPIIGYIMGVVGKHLKSHSNRAQEYFSMILSTTEESIGGLRIIKAFNAESQMKGRFDNETRALYRETCHIHRRIAMAHPVSEFCGTIAVALVLWFGGSLILSGSSSIDAATFIFYMLMFYSIIQPAKELSRAGYTVQKGVASLQRIDKIMSATNPIQDPEAPKSMVYAKNHLSDIEFKNVTFEYSEGVPVLQNIDLKIEPGKTVAIVGQSGSGKSTLVDLIPRFWDVTEGEVLVDGVNVKDYKVRDLRSLMGNVNQEAILFNDTFFNNIAFGVEGATMEQVEAVAKIANAHDFIIATPDGYNTVVGDRGCRLSGGQRQRVSIARALLKNPKILILDEATSALDTESERLVQEALERLMKDRTTVVIAHRLSTITNADEICVMHEGRIVERGTHDELISLGGHYKHLVDMQQV